MKRALAMLFALVALAGAFAQDAKPSLAFGMYGKLTNQIAALDSFGFYTETYLSYKGKDMGLAATVVSGPDLLAQPRNYSFWYTPCPVYKLQAGRLRETGSARLTSYIDGNGFSTRLADSQDGFMVSLFPYLVPFDGMSASLFIPVTGIDFFDDFHKFSAGLSWAVPELATFVASYRRQNLEVALGADVKAVKDATLRLGYKGIGMAIFTPAQSLLYLSAGSKGIARNLNLGLDANMTVIPAFSLGIKGMAEYTLGRYIVGTQASWDNGDVWYGNNNLAGLVYVKMNFASGSIKMALTYNAAAKSVAVPVDFEISF